jgi:hypothetical protein
VIIESLAATAAIFLLIVVITQIAFVVVAQTTARTAVAASARRASRPGGDPTVEQRRLVGELSRVVPGAAGVAATVTIGADRAHAAAEIRWAPPGPDLLPVTLRVSADAPRVVPP